MRYEGSFNTSKRNHLHLRCFIIRTFRSFHKIANFQLALAVPLLGVWRPTLGPWRPSGQPASTMTALGALNPLHPKFDLKVLTKRLSACES